jgi:uncharacterized delta-60 repeat protein
MPNFKGLSYSIVGDEKKSATSLKRESELTSGLSSGFSRLNFNVKIPPKGLTLSFTPKKLFKKKIKDLIKLKPKLVDLSGFQNLGFQSSLVGYDENAILLGNTDKPMSPRLMNWVEPYLISGFKKTLFYTEVNSGLKEGDRVFIIGGNYDSDELIKEDKYKGGRDGYKVLYVDKCQVVLDIDYDGMKPWQEDDDDNFIRAHFINNIDDFISVEKAITTRGGQFDRKFNKYQNNIIYTNKNYGPVTVWGNLVKLSEAPGFFVRTPSPILSIDSTFNSLGIGFNLTGQVYDIVKQPDGKLIVGGSFTTYNGVSVGRIIRLLSNGNIDNTFNSGGVGFNGIVESIGLQSNGKIIVGGRFTSYNGSGTLNSRLIRLNSNGTPDNIFITTGYSWVFGQERINKVLVIPTGIAGADNIYIGGNFTTIQSNSRNRIARLNSNGTLDTTFNPGSGFNGTGLDLVKTIAIQPDGKILVGGSFTVYNGIQIRKVIRLLDTGTSDIPNFMINGFPNNSNISVYSIEVQADGSILVGGNFTSYSLTPVFKIARFDSNCSLDTSFITNSNLLQLDSDVRTILFNNGEIYLGGNFINYSKILRLNIDGTINEIIPTQSGFNYTVYKLILDSTNKLVVGGDFSYFNSVAVRKITRLETTNWLNITNKFIVGSFSEALSPTYYNNGKVKVFNGSFTYSINEPVNFRKDYVYKFDKAEEPNNFQGTYSTWKVDVKYLRPIISKTNFRDGNFDGEWNVGLFGRHDKQIIWEGDVSKWNTGTLLNTRWLKGDLKSKFSLTESYYTEVDNDGFPSQKLNGPNNNGRGFNFLIDSVMLKSKIENASFYDSNLGSTNTSYSVVEKKILNSSFTADVDVRRAYFENCVFRNAKVKNSEIRTSTAINSDLDNIKTVNSYFKKSYIKNSDYISDNVVKILSYDEFNIYMDSNFNSPTHKVYKFYIRKSDYHRLNQGDYFYLKGIDVVDGQKKLLNIFDKKFKLTHWYEYDDVLDSNDNFYKRGIDLSAFLTTPEENSYTYTTVKDLAGNISNQVVLANVNKNYSVDIIYSMFDKNNLPVSGLNLNRADTVFQLYGNETLLVNYGESQTLQSGAILTGFLSNGGFGYSNSNGVSSNSLSGLGATFDITTSTSGILSLGVVSSPGTGYIDDVGVITTGINGTGATLNITTIGGSVISATIDFGGYGYIVGDVLTISGGNNDATFTVSSVSGGVITDISVNNPGGGYSEGDVITILGGNGVATFVVSTATTLPTYTNNYENTISPSGYYDGYPYYQLLDGTSNTISYIFFTSSSYSSPGTGRWEHWQSFNPITGATSGQFYTTLSTTNSVPDSSTISWIQDVDTNQFIFNSTIYNPSASLPQYFGNIVNTTNGYVIDSDFESGVLERSNWNSGSFINLNNDANITLQTNKGGFYNLTLQTNTDTLIANTTNDNSAREMNEDCFDVGTVVFLNTVTYDTRGKIFGFTLSSIGSGYLAGSQIPLVGGSGTGSSVTITSSPIGTILNLTLQNQGFGYTPAATGGVVFNVSTNNITGFGFGLTVNIVVDFGGPSNTEVTSAIINNPGIGYQVGDIVTINQNGPSTPLTFAELLITSISNGGVTSVSLNFGGIQYTPGDVLTISGGNNNATVTVLSVTGSKVKLPDTYKVINKISNSQFELKEVTSGTTSLAPLLDGGIFYTELANNRYGYLHQAKFITNSVKSGFLKKIYLKQNLLKNFDINLQDKDFNNLLLFKNLLFSDVLFTNNSNILSKASYVQSIFSEGDDYWDEGLLYNSVWNGGIFRNGLVKESSWHDGTFVTGLFYQSRSFNANPSLTYQYYDVDRIKNYWKDGATSPIISNDRYSWRGGTFSSGEFLKSDWEKGLFVTGKFWNSKWYAGTFSSGVIGDKSLTFADTWFYNGLIKTAIVENAALYGVDSSYYGLSQSNIVWETGTFNNGIFGCDIINQQSSYHTALWKTGTFNGGEFRTNGKWLTGTFNGGKFISGFGWTYSLTLNQMSNLKSEYAWETGEFNGGEFGDMGMATNSTWWSGEFNGGLFQGRIWNEGVFTSGRFRGSGPVTPVGGYSVDAMTESNASIFIDSFSSSFYGVWKSGIVSDSKDDFIKDKKLFTIPVRSVITSVPKTIVNFDNMLWLSGSFSHPGGTITKSVWLDGSFKRGKFKESSFNPWVTRIGDSTPSFNLNDDLIQASGSCIWEDGRLEESDFYISQWKRGQFLTGTAFGMVWKDGVTNYMNAYNVFWENGTWRNGNWNGSYFVFDGDITPDFNKQIIWRGMSWADSPYLHVWNVFKEEIAESELLSASASTVSIINVFDSIITVDFPNIRSDFRLKENLVKIGISNNGINIYRFNYIGENKIYQGVIAQELLNTQYENSLKLVDGYYHVNYSIIDVEFKEINI